MNCMTVTLRGAKSLHLCYPDREVADQVVRNFDRDISVAADGYLIVLSNDDGKIIAFLKRDFRSIELSELDESGEESLEGEPEAEESLTPLRPTKLESALADIVPAMHPRRRTPSPGAQSSNMRNLH
jgi:hypothetical protein